jgi:TPR repeat protein
MIPDARTDRRVTGWAPLAALAVALVVGPASAAAQLPGADPACSGAAAERCYLEGLAQARTALSQEDPRGAGLRAPVELLLGACGGGVGDGCYLAARLTETSAEADPDDYDAMAAAAARAVHLFSAGCVATPRPSGAGCTAAGFHHAERPRETHLDSALFFLERGCALEEPASCYRLAELHDEWLNPGVPRSRAATQRIQAACDAGSPGACLSAARRREQPLAHASPARRATATFRRERDAVRRAYAAACTADSLAGCTAVGALHAEGRMGLPVNPDSARHYLEPACKGRPEARVLGYGSACHYLGRMLAGLGPGPADTLPPAATRVDTARAVEFLRQGCTLLDFNACADLAYHGYRMGAEPAATALFRARTLCDEGRGVACRVAGVLGREAVTDDPQEAERSLRRACLLDDGRGCRELGQAMEADSARKYLRRACVLGDGAGCRMFADLGASVDLTPTSAQTALLARACALGDAEGCWRLMEGARTDGREVEEGEYRTRACRLDPAYCKRRWF